MNRQSNKNYNQRIGDDPQGYGYGYENSGQTSMQDYQRAIRESQTDYYDSGYNDGYDDAYEEEQYAPEDEYSGPEFSASRGIAYKPIKQKKRNILLAVIMTTVVGISGFVFGKIIQTKKEDPEAVKKPTVIQTTEKRPSIVEEEEDIPQILSVTLNTTEPVFGTSRLKIDYEVDADAMVRIEILNADDTVFTTIESAAQVSEGKMRTYFDGYNQDGDWISIGNYKVRVSALKLDSTSPKPDKNEETGELDYTNVIWVVDNFLTADFAVVQEPYRTPNSRPAQIPTTPTPSESEEPEPTESEEPAPTESEEPAPTESEEPAPTTSEPAPTTSEPVPTTSEPTEGETGGN